MIFSSTIFLFGFLPCILAIYYFLPLRLKNFFLLIVSLFFYAWGELEYTLLMLFSIFWNYCLGMVVQRSENNRFLPLFVGVSGNLLILSYYKYTNFILDSINHVFSFFQIVPISVEPVHLPLGISFFTFQAISYLVDVYRRVTPAQTNPLTLGLYIAMFPQLIAGPIVRYSTVAQQLISRKISLIQMEQGVERFVIGLSKKLLIANSLGEVADALFALPADQLTALTSWIAVFAYSLQIYFDFSGYSDMAIGLGLMFGFTFPENFNFPYSAKSVRDFWRRWHMSLTGWLRDYLYIPLGGNRRSELRTKINLLTVFLLCGLWHGASWTFIVWGAWHGFFLLCERSGWGATLRKLPSVFQHAYMLTVVVLGWVFFRSDSLEMSRDVLTAMVGLNGLTSDLYPIQLYLSGEALAAACAGIAFSIPLFSNVWCRVMTGSLGFASRFTLLSLLLAGSFMKISSGTYNPFLYFRF